MTFEKIEEGFITENKNTFYFGTELFGDSFNKYAYFFIDYPQNFEKFKAYAERCNFEVSKESVIKFDDKPFGFDQFVIMLPMINSIDKIQEIIYGNNDILNYYITEYGYLEVFDLLLLEIIAQDINSSSE